MSSETSTIVLLTSEPKNPALDFTGFSKIGAQFLE